MIVLRELGVRRHVDRRHDHFEVFVLSEALLDEICKDRLVRGGWVDVGVVTAAGVSVSFHGLGLDTRRLLGLQQATLLRAMASFVFLVFGGVQAISMARQGTCKS